MDGYSKWFKDLDKAQAFFEEFAADLEADLEGTGESELVKLINLKTGETLSKHEING